MAGFNGKVALVTGAGRGLGRATAQIFSRDGARVVVVDLLPERGEETVQLIKDAGGEAIFVKADVSKSSEVQAMVKAAVDTFGGLDCAVNNAVVALNRMPLADFSDEDWHRSMAVNLTGVFFCMKYEIKAMLERGAGAIVNIGSGNEFGCAPGVGPYIAAKHGIYGMTKVAALDYGGRGIRVNAVGPGTMLTPLMLEAASKNPKHIESLMALTPMRRFAQPEEVAEVAVWACSDKASYVLGSTITVDGGAMLT
jgi:NAD(P)-dependent dehydrogenase (short-subunit alcohol dehydrogenase family)